MNQSNKVEINPAPDYSNLYYWAAHPLKKDPSDSIPAFCLNEKSDSLADVFYIHPTTFLKNMFSASWNANVNDEELNSQTDKTTLLKQASIFNGSCKVYAPRYRQAHLKAFIMKQNPKSAEALDIAYNDVKKAFDYYVENYNHKRPIIIAGHSQGAGLGKRLLKDYFGKPLQKQLVCAYIIGTNIKKDEFTSIPFGDNPTATGCIVGWRTYKNGTIEKNIQEERGNSQCVNPITWVTNSTEAPEELHKGMIGADFNKLLPHVVSAKVEPSAKILWITSDQPIGERASSMNNLHILDVSMFYMDIRENVKQRIASFKQFWYNNL